MPDCIMRRCISRICRRQIVIVGIEELLMPSTCCRHCEDTPTMFSYRRYPKTGNVHTCQCVMLASAQVQLHACRRQFQSTLTLLFFFPSATVGSVDRPTSVATLRLYRIRLHVFRPTQTIFGICKRPSRDISISSGHQEISPFLLISFSLFIIFPFLLSQFDGVTSVVNLSTPPTILKLLKID